uniref:RETREG1-3/ARL6IP-like N-terminal reticulon-homology domain-containing protein n=1 Tax=Strigamia maritima TaxID=126957 RepID=T1J8I9_STRMM
MASISTMYRRIFPFTINPSTESVLTASQTMKEKAISKLLSPFESYVVSIQSILIWENMYLSAITLLLVNFLFWLVVSYSHRFYSIVATIGILVFTYRTWVNQIWPEIRVTPTEDEDMEEDFCIIMTAVLSGLIVIGNCISGVWLSYILVMSIMLGPAMIIHVLPKAQEKLNGRLSRFLQLELPIILPMLRIVGGEDATTQNNELDEYIPETTSQTLMELDVPMFSSEIEIGGPSSMPSVHRIEELLDDEDDEMALPADALADEPSIECDVDDEIKEEDLSLSLKSDQSSSEIRFVASHFEDSDSDDEAIKEFTEGLRFTDSNDSSQLPLTDEQNENFTAVISAIASTVPQITAASQNLMSTILSPSLMAPTERQQSVLQRFPNTEADDLTDFEVVSESELDPGVDD